MNRTPELPEDADEGAAEGRSEGRLAAPESVLDASVGREGRRGGVRAVAADVEDRPWGSVVTWAATEEYQGRILNLQAGEAFSLHFHEERDETLYLLSGKVALEAGPGLDAVRPVPFEVGMSIRLPPGIMHRVTALEDAVLLEASTAVDDDQVRVRDLYDRVPHREGR
jgi:mannose-6-phosphate isomerase